MALLSVVQAALPVTYTFDQSFYIVDQGRGHWGAIDPDGARVSGNSSVGNEWNGAIAFTGAVTSIFWITRGTKTGTASTLALMGLGLAGLAARRRR